MVGNGGRWLVGRHVLHGGPDNAKALERGGRYIYFLNIKILNEFFLFCFQTVKYCLLNCIKKSTKSLINKRHSKIDIYQAAADFAICLKKYSVCVMLIKTDETRIKLWNLTALRPN